MDKRIYEWNGQIQNYLWHTWADKSKRKCWNSRRVCLIDYLHLCETLFYHNRVWPWWFFSPRNKKNRCNNQKLVKNYESGHKRELIGIKTAIFVHYIKKILLNVCSFCWIDDLFHIKFWSKNWQIDHISLSNLLCVCWDWKWSHLMGLFNHS